MGRQRERESEDGRKKNKGGALRWMMSVPVFTARTGERERDLSLGEGSSLVGRARKTCLGVLSVIPRKPQLGLGLLDLLPLP